MRGVKRTVKYPPMNLEEVLRRVEQRLQIVGLTAHAASKQAKKVDAIRNLQRAVKGEGPSRHGVNAATIEALAPVLRTTASWLLEGAGAEETDPAAPQPIFDERLAAAEVAGSGRVNLNIAAENIPEFDLRAGASFAGGRGIEVEVADENGNHFTGDLVRAEWKIPDYYLASNGMRSNRAHILPIDGPSMLPDLAPDDRVLIDLDDTNPGRDGIFAIWDDAAQSVIVKNVQIVRDSDPPRICCISSNKTYPPFEIILDGSSRIIGRVKRRITAV